MTPREERFVIRSACGADFAMYCGGLRPGLGRVAACLHYNRNNLSPRCQQALMALQTKMKIETERGNIRAIDPLTKREGPALIATLRTAIEQFPDLPQALAWRNRLAMTLAQEDRHKEAADVLEELGARNPTAPNDVYFRLGELYERRLKDPGKAKEAYAKVPPGSPRYDDAQRKLKQK